MTSAIRTMAACLADAELDYKLAAASLWSSPADAIIIRLLEWQRAKACQAHQEALQIVDDKTLDELNQIEHEARLAARSACEAVGIEWRMLGEIS